MVTFSNSFLRYLLSEKEKGSTIARLLFNAHNRWYAYPAYDKIVTNTEVDYLTLRTDGLISYLPAGKEHKTNEAGEWSREGRQSGKPAKVIRKVFTEKMLRFIPAKEFESFGNAYKAKFLDNGFRFELKPNIEIPNVYCKIERAPGDGSLNNSCMNGDRDYLDIYKKCKALQILTLIGKDELLYGRALVWTLNHHGFGDITFMDRIYVTEDYMYDMFLTHASDNGWWRKVMYKTYSDKQAWVSPSGEKQTVMATIYTDTDCDEYPYIDTFSYGNDGTLTNTGVSCQYTYNETDGCREGDRNDHDDDDTYDEVNDTYIHSDNAVYLGERGDPRYRNRTTHADNAVEVIMTTGGRCQWMHENDSNYVRIGDFNYYTDHPSVITRADGEYDVTDNCVLCQTDGEYYEIGDSDILQANNDLYYHKHNDDRVIYVANEGYCYMPDVEGYVVDVVGHGWYKKDSNSIVKIDGDWYEKDDNRIVQINERWYLKANATIVTRVVCYKNTINTYDEWHPINRSVCFIDGVVNGLPVNDWYLKKDLIRFRNRYFRKDDDRIKNRITTKKSTTKKRKAQLI